MDGCGHFEQDPGFAKEPVGSNIEPAKAEIKPALPYIYLRFIKLLSEPTHRGGALENTGMRWPSHWLTAALAAVLLLPEAAAVAVDATGIADITQPT